MRDQELTDALTHYVSLAKEPGWKSYVWARVQEMADAHPNLYGELPALLVKEMKRESSQD